MRFPAFGGKAAARTVAVLAAGTMATGLLTTPAASAAAVPAAPTPDCTGYTTTMTSAADYWLANGANQAPADWQNAVFNVGNLALVRTTGVSNHKTLPWASANKYQLLPDAPDKP